MEAEKKDEPPTVKQAFAARLTAFRKGAEKDSFWRGLNLNAAKMGRYENNKEAPSIEKIVEICEKTRLSPNWLLMGLEPEKLSGKDFRAQELKPPPDEKEVYDVITSRERGDDSPTGGHDNRGKGKAKKARLSAVPARGNKGDPDNGKKQS